mgnify:CR=1 FL=1
MCTEFLGIKFHIMHIKSHLIARIQKTNLSQNFLPRLLTQQQREFVSRKCIKKGVFFCEILEMLLDEARALLLDGRG